MIATQAAEYHNGKVLLTTRFSHLLDRCLGRQEHPRLVSNPKQTLGKVVGLQSQEVMPSATKP